MSGGSLREINGIKLGYIIIKLFYFISNFNLLQLYLIINILGYLSQYNVGNISEGMQCITAFNDKQIDRCSKNDLSVFNEMEI